MKSKRGISLIILILIIVALVVVSGIIIGIVIINKNKNKEPITENEFKEKMEDLNYAIYDISNQENLYAFIEKAYVALKGENEYQIEFYRTDKEENAVYLFNINKNKIEAYKSAEYSETSSNIGNNSKYTMTTADTYKVISRIDDTIIYADVDKEYKEEVKEVLKELGY